MGEVCGLTTSERINSAGRQSVLSWLADRAYSGEFKSRILPELHRAVVIKAAEKKVSLNCLVNLRLAGYAGCRVEASVICR